MKSETETLEPESSLSIEARRIARVERFRLRKVKTVEDLLVQLGYDPPGDPTRTSRSTGGRRRRYGRAWAWRAATGRRAGRACRRGLSWLR